MGKYGKLFGYIGNNKELTVMNDVKIPWVQDSNGPNGVLTDVGETELSKYGNVKEPRMNLFYKDWKSTMKLLDDYLELRNNNELVILTKFVELLGKAETKADLNAN